MSGTDAAAAQPRGAARAARVELERLLASVPAMTVDLPTSCLDLLERYVRLLLEANQRLNLTRITRPADIARLHLLDALAALPLLDRTGPRDAVDLGAGGGVPGIPLAIARPDMRWLLVDSVQKKAAALSAFVADLGLRNVQVLAERAEVVGHDPAHREGHDLVAARACAELPVLVELALPLLRIGGTLVAWKGGLSDSDPELTRGASASPQVGGGRPRLLPAGAPLGGHTFVTVPKQRPTPDRFPRRPGEPSRRPLA